MAQRLETFAKKNRIRIVFEQITIERILVKDGEESVTKKVNWSCDLLPPLLGQGFSYSRSTPGGAISGTLFPTHGETRKQVRDAMVKHIRGIKLQTGHKSDLIFKVPDDLL